MKKRGSGKRTSLSQGVLSVNNGDAIRNLSKTIHEARTGHITGDKVSDHGSSQDGNDNFFKPRQTTPTKSVSVDRPKLLTELSLSDVEMNGKDDIPPKSTPVKQRRREGGAEVIVIETKDDDGMLGGEVATRSFTMQSPARVICHSPSLSPTNEGIVPNISIATHNKSTNRSLDDKYTPKNVLGDKYKESNSLDSKRKDGGKVVITRGKDSANKSKSKTTVATTTTTTTTTTVKKKKKRYLPVESRYRKPTVQKDDDKFRSLELSAIPQVDGKSSNEKKPATRAHSTPYHINSLYEVQADDGSILDTTAFQTRERQVTENMKKKNKTRKGGENKENNEKIDYPEPANKSREIIKDSNGEISRLAVELHYSRLVETMYTNLKAKQTFEKQEEKAKAELYTLWSVNCKMEKEIKALMHTVESKNAQIAVDHLLRSQVEGFGMLNNKLSKVVVTTSKLSDALSNSSQYLPVKNIIIKNEGELIHSLDESKRLLADLGSLTRINHSKIEEFATASDVLKKTLHSEVAEQKSCTELLDACTTLTNQERSLQTQVLQSGS